MVATDEPGDAPLILVVDDDTRFREQLARAFVRRGFGVVSAASYDEALSLAKQESPEFAVVDLRMPGPGGIEVLKALREIDPETRVVMLSGYGSIATAVEAVHLGALNFLQKPADADEVLAALGLADEKAEETSEPQTPSLERVKWEHMQRVLADSHGNISEAARKLKLHRRSLQRMLQKDPPRE
jgi:two-component system response regulator RegA